MRKRDSSNLADKKDQALEAGENGRTLICFQAAQKTL
jgi:hypothetical protein